jgi:maltose alpha-D-glucosyltransferase/alpha-amylase
VANRKDPVSWENDPLWYKDAIIYELHTKAFLDANGDGIGDFRGLAAKLDYLQELGVNTIWLLPFYPSPLRDDGYDIADYRNIHPDYGTRGDFRNFVREAHRRGLKVITELVINHTSDQHPWFQAARRAPAGSAKRRYYVWSDSDQKYSDTRIIFTDTEVSNWAWDPEAQAYYWHRFFSHQPDLNFDNPQVVKAVTRVMRFWLDMGVDGFRLDAIPYLREREGTNNENLPETHEVLKEMRAVVDAHYANRLFLAEANQWPEDVRDYFGEGDECHMAYHFPLMPRMYMAVAQEDRHPIVEIMQQTPEIPETCQWAVFLRNHDELTLEMVTDHERDYMYHTYASERRARINIGIRRRLAPLMDNNVDKIKLMNTLLMSMPGTPIIYYGDEIGMGDNFFLGDRDGVRTPMQWSPDRNAGFSRADPQRLYLPPIMDPIYGYEAVNVESQWRDPSSLLNWMRRLIALRKAHRAFGRGTLEFLYPGNRKVLAYLREYDDDLILCVANLSRHAQPVELELAAFRGRVPVEMMGGVPFPPVGELPYLLTLPGYGVYWFRLTTEGEVPVWHEDVLPPVELPVLVLIDRWAGFFPASLPASSRRVGEKLLEQLERDLLPRFMAAQRWFAHKGDAIERARFEQTGVWAHDRQSWLLAWITVESAEAGADRYFLPLSTIWDAEDENIQPLRPRTLAKIRERAKTGILCEAFVDPAFCEALVRAMQGGESIAFGEGRLHFRGNAVLDAAIRDVEEWSVRHPGTEGTNTSLLIGERLFLKGYRRLSVGINPEVEMGRYLTEVANFEHVAPLAGTLDYTGPGGERVTLALVQGRVRAQGDAWRYTTGHLERFIDDLSFGRGGRDVPPAEEAHGGFMLTMRILGRRTGELHRALSAPTDDPAFAPERMRKRDVDAWRRKLKAELRATLARLRRARAQLTGRTLERAQALLAAQVALGKRIDALLPATLAVEKIRHHGDYHLGQVLVAEDDVVIIDFEGEPARPLEERRAKGTALRDVAGILRSLSYAGHVTLVRATSEERPTAFETLAPHIGEWERLAARTFLDAYFEAMEDSPVLPESGTCDDLIAVCVLEKALYEVRYELDNRPDWVDVPLAALHDLSPTTLDRAPHALVVPSRHSLAARRTPP